MENGRIKFQTTRADLSSGQAHLFQFVEWNAKLRRFLPPPSSLPSLRRSIVHIYIYIYSHRENSGWNCGQRTRTGRAEMARILTLRHRSFCFVLDSLFEGYGPVNNEPLQPQYILSEKLENISDTQSTAELVSSSSSSFFFPFSFYLLYFIPNRFEWNTFHFVFSILFVERFDVKLSITLRLILDTFGFYNYFSSFDFVYDK